MTLQPADLDRLEQLAREATPEAWDQWDWSSWRELPADGDAAGMWALDPYQTRANVALTIALSPAVVSELVAAARLGAAWQEAEAAWPEIETWRFGSWSEPNGTHWGVTVEKQIAFGRGGGSRYRRVFGEGPTPAAALTALVEALRERP